MKKILGIDKDIVSRFCSRIGLYKPLRYIYNKIGRFNKLTIISAQKDTFKFRSPTFYIHESISSFYIEKELIDMFIGNLRSDDIVWDIGANMGFYSILSAKKILPDGLIYAFEPEKNCFSLLRKNIKINGMTNIIPMHYALGNTNGRAPLFSSDTPSNGTHCLVQRTDFKLKKKGTFVNIIRADSLIEDGGAPVPNVIKIDVEGAEILVLQGMENILKNKSLRIIQCEMHTNILPLFDATVTDVESIIIKAGFSIIYKKSRLHQFHVVFKRIEQN